MGEEVSEVPKELVGKTPTRIILQPCVHAGTISACVALPSETFVKLIQ